ncbi:MAG: hypothetical protein V3R89_00795 [Thermoanaerobaculia bacterium]
MSDLNAVLRTLVDLVLVPFRTLPPWVGLSVVSLAAAIGMLWLFKATSNQKALVAVKRQIHAGLFELRLFNEDLRDIFRGMFEILRHNLTYLRHSLVPMVWILPPLVLLMAQLHPHYGYSGVEPGRPTQLVVELSQEAAGSGGEAAAEKPAVTLEVPDGVRVETPAVWIPSLRQLAWRISVREPGEYELHVRVQDQLYSKTLNATTSVVRRSAKRVTKLVDQFLFPVERPLPKEASVRSISISYPEAEWLGLPQWLWLFFVLSVLFAFALRNRLGVTI